MERRNFEKKQLKNQLLSADLLAQNLEGRRSGKGWIAKCPAHEDNKPSLSIGVGRNGRPLVHCFSGCTQDELIQELKKRDLW